MLDGGGEVAGALGVVWGEALECVEVGVGVGVFVAEGEEVGGGGSELLLGLLEGVLVG